jgi:catechol 2,3-dioxygenase-like lactoylglutathione lyase family enzyme
MIQLKRTSIIAVGLLAALKVYGQPATEPIVLTSRHATASVGDLDRAVKWYQEKLDFKVEVRRKLDSATEMVRMTNSGYRIDLLHRNGSSRAPSPKDHLLAQGWAHIVFSVADADHTYAVLKARGVNLPEPVANDPVFHAKYTHFPDSEGNWLALYQEGAAPGKK